MKTSLLPVLTCLLAGQVMTSFVSAQSANTTLSNLGSTSVNADLVPSADNVRSLGSSSKAWKQLYVKSLVFLGGARFLAYGNAISLQNTGIGSFSIASTTTGYNNTGVGAYTLRANVSGYNNVAVGYTSLFKSVAGHNNVAVGAASLYNNTSGVSNSAFGNNALLSNTSGNNNMAIGANALYYNKTGTGNVAIGIRALFKNLSDYSVAVGDSAMLNYALLKGPGNTAVGSKAMYSNIKGTGDIAIGRKAFYTGTGSNNIAIGDQAMVYGASGSENIAVGVNAMAFNNGGNYNVGIGNGTMYNNKTGMYNTTLGHKALEANGDESYSTAVGALALSNSTAGANTAVGYQALVSNNTGSDNVAVGYNAMVNNSSGYSNTAMGSQAMNASGNTTGTYNTATGFGTAFNHIGNYNLYLGASADANADWANSAAIGYQAVISDNNQIRLGNINLVSVASTGQYVYLSDGRYKKEIKKNVPGLDFVKLLEPVTYHVDAHGLTKKLSDGMKTGNGAQKTTAFDEAGMQNKEKILYTGFVAQDVEKAAAKVNYDFSGVHKPSSDHDVYGLAYSEFVVPLVKAVQQLSDSNDVKQKKIDSLAGAVTELRNEMDELKRLVSGNGLTGMAGGKGSLDQNTPNPVRNATSIIYTLPASYGRAKIMITDMNGRAIQTIPVAGRGAGSLTVNTASLAAGSYPYALYVDGVIVGTRQMLVVR